MALLTWFCLDAHSSIGTRNVEKARTLTDVYYKKSNRDFEQDIITNGQLGCTGVICPNTKTGNKVYTIFNGQIDINGERYPCNLPDGDYEIRKMKITECKRLQTVPDSYEFPVSDTQAYKMLGNGWTVDVIVHIMSHFGGITTEPVEVLSMYDGMSCGRLALEKLGANVVRYYATEIDKYTIKTTQHNYPDTIQLGDAFQVREDNWRLPDGH